MAKMKMEVKLVTMKTYEGKQIPGGVEMTPAEFAKSRNARLSILGKIDGKDVEVLFTRRSTPQGEFAALCDIAGKRGVLEGEFDNIRTHDRIEGQLVKLKNTRADLKTTTDTGDLAFKFTPAPVAKWAEKFGSVSFDMVNYGTSEENIQNYRNLLKRNREEAELPTLS